MSTSRTTYDEPAFAGAAVEPDSRAVLGQTMGVFNVFLFFLNLFGGDE